VNKEIFWWRRLAVFIHTLSQPLYYFYVRAYAIPGAQEAGELIYRDLIFLLPD
jgi:hypothetical protein